MISEGKQLSIWYHYRIRGEEAIASGTFLSHPPHQHQPLCHASNGSIWDDDDPGGKKE